MYLFCSFLPTISRIAYYFTVTQILYVPALLDRLLNDKDSKRYRLGQIFKVVTIAGCILYFTVFMKRAGDDGLRILPYETFLFHELPATLSERGFG